jgi:hypothetical protein
MAMISLLRLKEMGNMRRFRCTILVALFIAPCLLIAGGQKEAFGKEELEVVRDKDKTTYIMGGDDGANQREQDRDKERAWQMLQNQNLWIDGRGRRPNPGTAK